MNTFKHISSRGQTAIEYLLLFGIVAFVVFTAFAPGGFMNQVHDTSGGYFNKVSSVIMGDNPAPINGGWCPWSGCAGGISYRTCECPAPAFGGVACSGSNQQGCS